MNVMPVYRHRNSPSLRRLIRQSLAQSEDVSLAQLRASSIVQPRLSEPELQTLARALVPRLREIDRLYFR